MNGIARLAGPRTFAVALAFGLSLFSPLASGVAAAPISSPPGETGRGRRGTAAVPGYRGENVISFVGVTDGTFDDVSSRFSLGQFQIAPLPPGNITYYDNTAFTIELNTSAGGMSSRRILPKCRTAASFFPASCSASSSAGTPPAWSLGSIRSSQTSCP